MYCSFHCSESLGGIKEPGIVLHGKMDSAAPFGIVSGIKEELGNLVFRQKSLYGEQAVEKIEGIMARGRLEQREYGQVVLGIGSREHIETIPIVKTVPAGIPANITIGLSVKSVTIAGWYAAFFAIARPFFSLQDGSDNEILAGPMAAG